MVLVLDLDLDLVLVNGVEEVMSVYGVVRRCFVRSRSLRLWFRCLHVSHVCDDSNETLSLLVSWEI
jgi:hypothetical protein